MPREKTRRLGADLGGSTVVGGGPAGGTGPVCGRGNAARPKGMPNTASFAPTSVLLIPVAHRRMIRARAPGPVRSWAARTAPTAGARTDAPHIVFHLNTTGFSSITVSYNLHDIDGSADSALQPVALWATRPWLGQEDLVRPRPPSALSGRGEAFDRGGRFQRAGQKGKFT